MFRLSAATLALLALCLDASSAAATTPPSTRRPLDPCEPARRHLRIVTYNILGGRGTDGAKDLGRVAEVILALNPDLVGLQEVDQKTKRLDGQDTMAELAKRTSLTPAFAEAMPFGGGSFGVGALSRFPISRQTPHRLPNKPEREPRVALEIECLHPSGHNLAFLTTHLDHAEMGILRDAQMTYLSDLFEKRPNSLVILSGDMNATPDSAEMEKLGRLWTPTWPSERAGSTWPSHQPKVRIDHLLVRPAKSWKVIKTFRADEAYPLDQNWILLLRKTSDHLPVVVEVEIL